MHRKGRLLLLLILPDGSKSLIPADWTDLASPTQTLSAPTTLGSLDDLLHAWAIADALLNRLAPVTGGDGNSAKMKESTVAKQKSEPVRPCPRRNLSLGNPRRGIQKPRHPDPGTAHRAGRSRRPGEGKES